MCDRECSGILGCRGRNRNTSTREGLGLARGECLFDLAEAIVQIADDTEVVGEEPIQIPYQGDRAPVRRIAYVKQVIADVYLIQKDGWVKLRKSVRSHIERLQHTSTADCSINHPPLLESILEYTGITRAASGKGISHYQERRPVIEREHLWGVKRVQFGPIRIHKL